MSIVSLSAGEPTCTSEDLKAIAHKNKFEIGTGDKTSFFLFQDSVDATCQAIKELQEYEEPRTKPCAVEGGERTFYVPNSDENPLGAWAGKSRLLSIDHAAKNGPLSGRTIALKDIVSVAGISLCLGTSPELLKDGKHAVPNIDATVVSRNLAAGAELRGTTT